MNHAVIIFTVVSYKWPYVDFFTKLAQGKSIMAKNTARILNHDRNGYKYDSVIRS